MAKKSSTGKAISVKTKSPSTSGAIGGPSTDRGLSYQINFAIRHALDLISKVLSSPYESNIKIQLEPRTIGHNKSVTKWDIGILSSNALVEAKLKPKREDIVEWLERIEQSNLLNNEQFWFVYGEGGGVLLDAVNDLCRVCRESSGNKAQFDFLIAHEKIKDSAEVLKILGNNYYDFLNRIDLKNIPENTMLDFVKFQAKLMSGKDEGEGLRRFLSDKFHTAISGRLTYFVSDLIKEGNSIGIHIDIPQQVDRTNISECLYETIVLLQESVYPLPLGVVAQCFELDTDLFVQELQNSEKKHIFIIQDNLLSVKQLARNFPIENSLNTLEKGIEFLLNYVSSLSSVGAKQQIHNIGAFSKKCLQSNPQLVSKVFSKLDKFVKNLGNKQLVLQIAGLSKEAANLTKPRDERIVEDEIRARICGTCWAYQRLYRLDEALLEANIALEMAKSIRSDINIAFSSKCLGRLKRLIAESSNDSEEKNKNLKESIENLNEAIAAFTKTSIHGPNSPEVGDCYSLLGRTYLVSKQFQDAKTSINEAYNRIPEGTNKDYLDLVLLDGDWQVAHSNWTAANNCYEKVLLSSNSNDLEISDMRARAFLKRGQSYANEAKRDLALKKNTSSLNNKKLAIKNMEQAIEIWQSLEEHSSAAMAQWEKILVEDILSDEFLKLLNKELSYMVRVKAVEVYNARTSGYSFQGSPQRAKVPHQIMLQCIDEAKLRVTIEVGEV